LQDTKAELIMQTKAAKPNRIGVFITRLQKIYVTADADITLVITLPLGDGKRGKTIR
jgi:hypothetical protein